MRIREMHEREAFGDILAATLQTGWSAQLHREVHVGLGAGQGQTWLVQPTLGAFVTLNATRAVRRFVADSFRFTPKRLRLPAQFMLGTALASRGGLRIFARPGFHVDPPIPEAEHLAVVPGNARVRVFDFARGRVRVLLKAGFSAESQRREIAARADGDSLYPPIIAHAPDATWFEEPLIEGYALPRLPPWRSRRRAEARAFALLATYLARSEEETSAGQHAQALAAALTDQCAVLRTTLAWRSPTLDQGIAALVRAASELPRLNTAVGHGDFQPGNILVDRDGQVLIIDWEHSHRRMLDYDRLVYALATRSGAGLTGRLLAFLRGGGGRTLSSLAREARRPLLAMFALEDLLWFASESVAGPFRAPSRGLLHWERALRGILPELRLMTSPRQRG